MILTKAVTVMRLSAECCFRCAVFVYSYEHSYNPTLRINSLTRLSQHANGSESETLAFFGRSLEYEPAAEKPSPLVKQPSIHSQQTIKGIQRNLDIYVMEPYLWLSAEFGLQGGVNS